jgi:hypothetical protein
VEQDPDLAWLRSARVLAAATVGIVLGFVLGLVIFGEPWHLQPDWGDIPTWILAGLALAAGVAGYLQLDILRRQFAADKLRERKRDKLLDRQLAEAERRNAFDRRRQAEEVVVEVERRRRRGDLLVIVSNKSRRPIFDVSCQLLDSDVSATNNRSSVVEPQRRNLVDLSGRWRRRSNALGQSVNEPLITLFGPQPHLLATLRPDNACVFVFDLQHVPPSGFFVHAQFTDDAERRWELDQFQHLVDAGDLNIGDE